MRSFKETNIQNKRVHNSDRLSYLTSKSFFEDVVVLAGKLEIFLIHSDKSDFSTFKL